MSSKDYTKLQILNGPQSNQVPDDFQFPFFLSWVGKLGFPAFPIRWDMSDCCVAKLRESPYSWKMSVMMFWWYVCLGPLFFAVLRKETGWCNAQNLLHESIFGGASLIFQQSVSCSHESKHFHISVHHCNVGFWVWLQIGCSWCSQCIPSPQLFGSRFIDLTLLCQGDSSAQHLSGELSLKMHFLSVNILTILAFYTSVYLMILVNLCTI